MAADTVRGIKARYGKTDAELLRAMEARRARQKGALTMFRFTIRDVLWLTVVAGLAAALALQQRRANQSQQESELWRSRAESASAALNAAQRQNAWHGGNVVTIEQVEGITPGTSVPIQRVYRSKQ